MNERSILNAALDIQNPAERKAFLRNACRENPALTTQIEGLLSAQGGQRILLEVETGNECTLDFSSPDTDEEENCHVGVVLELLKPTQMSGSLGTLGHYEVLKVIGHGGYGVVLQAFDEKLHRHVALKVLNPQLAASPPSRKRFLREARAAAAIRHENIVQVYSVEEQPLPYIVMEYIAGETLKQRLDANGPLGAAEILDIAKQIAAGLAAAHANGLIHRDIKPSNILIEDNADRHVKITDFGLARAADDASVTCSGIVSGTPMYMSPEQAQGEALDHRTDLFSLGSVLYQLACGRAPFLATNTVAVLGRVSHDNPRPLSEILPETPDWLAAIISKLHAKRPENRFLSAREVAELMSCCQSELQLQGKVTEAGGRLQQLQQEWKASREHKTSRQTRAVPIRWGELKELRYAAIAIGVACALLFGFLLSDGSSLRQLPSRLHKPSARGPAASRTSPPAVADSANANLKQVAALPVAEQIEAVRKELRNLNPEFDGTLTFKCENGVITDLKFNTDHVTVISPVRTLLHLKSLEIQGTFPRNGVLSDLSPLQGMSLIKLDCSYTQVSDLSSLSGMPLTILFCNYTPVSDLVPLQGIPLVDLGIASTSVLDLSSLKDMKLRSLMATSIPAKDLAPLNGMPLRNLDLHGTSGVTDLHPLRRMPLEDVNLTNLPVSDLSILKGKTTLKHVNLNGTQATDGSLSQLRDCKNLKSVCVQKTIVTASGIDDLKTALPGCNIIWNEAKDRMVANPNADATAWEEFVSARENTDQAPAVGARLVAPHPRIDGSFFPPQRTKHKVSDKPAEEFPQENSSLTPPGDDS